MRQAFEEFIKNSPYEMSVERFPDDEDTQAWPGCYKDHTVGMMWETWVEAWNSAVHNAAKVCEDLAYQHAQSQFLGPELNSLRCAKMVNQTALLS